MKPYHIPGVPRSLRQDGWWLDGSTPVRPRHLSRRAPVYWVQTLVLAGLIMVAHLAQDVAEPGALRVIPVAGDCGAPSILGFRDAHLPRSLGPSQAKGTPL